MGSLTLGSSIDSVRHSCYATVLLSGSFGLVPDLIWITDVKVVVRGCRSEVEIGWLRRNF